MCSILQVFQALDVIPQTAGLEGRIGAEFDLVAFMAEEMQDFEPAFRAAVLRKWRSDAVSRMLRVRCVQQSVVAYVKQTNADFEARQRADIAKHGLR